MKVIIKTLSFAALITAAIIFMTGCNTVKGAFQGVGEDTHAAANALQLNNPPAKHHVTHKVHSTGKKVTTTTTTKTTTATSPDAVQSTPDAVQAQ